MRADTKFVALDKTRSTLLLLKKSSFEGREILVKQLTDLQQSLRYANADEVGPSNILEPFLSLLLAPYLAGPFKLAALESIQTFLNTELLAEFPSKTAEALANIVHAITRCKFIQTDATGDEIVQLNIIQTLNCVVKSSVRGFLADSTVWDIVETCYNILVHTSSSSSSSSSSSGTTRSQALCSSAERTLQDTVRLVFSGSLATPVQRDECADADTEVDVAMRSAPRLLRHFVDILHKNCADISLQKQAAKRAVSRTLTPLGDSSSLDPEVQELLLALKTINVMLLASRSSLTAADSILHSTVITNLIRDDLSKCLVLLCTRRDFSPLVLQAILSLFGTLFCSFGLFLRGLIECFIPYVYLKALHQLVNHFAKQYDLMLGPIVSDVDHYPPASSSGAFTPSTSISNASSNFNFDEMDMILESLADLVSDAGFLPTIFASYDCNPCATDIVKPLVRYLCQCSRYVMVMEGQRVGSNTSALYEHCSACLKHVMRTLSIRTNGKPCVSGSAEDVLEDSPAERAAATTEQLSDSLRALRGSKEILSEAAKRFCVKPEKGLRYLQELGALPTPITPASVAKFLRIARDLPKDVVGAFLGELGKDDANFEADGKDFHSEVLTCYVRSFSLKDQSVLNCMRIFLSAFRLPGEAQQIDRILVAFSEYCHSNSVEGQSALLENAEVTYLLTFSIIMLNTDRHNPNIKAERKMTKEQFVRNNTNYGADLKQTYPIPQEFLETIYNSISECPIRTESNDFNSDLTPEMWMDLQLQAAADYSRCVIISCCHPSDLVTSVAEIFKSKHFTMEADAEETPQDDVDAQTLYFGCSAVEVTLLLLTSKRTRDDLLLSRTLEGSYWFVDGNMIDCFWQDLLSVAVCPFIADRNSQRLLAGSAGNSPVPSYASPPGKLSLQSPSASIFHASSVGPNGLQLSIDIIVILVKLCHLYEMPSVVDVAVLFLAEFAGIIKPVAVDEVFASLPSSLYFERMGVSPTGQGSATPRTPVASRTTTKITTSAVTPSAVSTTDAFLETVINSVAARVALSSLLRLIQHHQTLFGAASWSVTWHVLSLLRDCVLLPMEMVVDPDPDFLPEAVRLDFETRLSSAREALAYSKTREQEAAAKANAKKSKSFLSLQGLGEALFGSSPAPVEVPAPVVEYRTLRWDEGYEANVVSAIDPSEGSFVAESSVQIGQIAALVDDFSIARAAFSIFISDIDESESQKIIENTFKCLRFLVAESGIAKLVADSRFLSETSLQYLLLSLTAATDKPVSLESDELDSLEVAERSVDERVGRVLRALPDSSAASCSWMEIILVEIAMRNRDRIMQIWPSVSAHYQSTLSKASSLTYVVERRIIGLFKLASRLLARDKLVDPILELIATLLLSDDLSPAFEDASEVKENAPCMNSELIRDLSGQISVGMWTLLTLNVTTLPSLRLEQWQVLFNVIAAVAKSGGFASIKSFEAMAWLLHEPRLRAEVPVFCIVALKPLLRNAEAPDSVSIGAIQLLSHLHTRLEVLIKDDVGTDSADITSDDLDEDAPLLWESSWIPILHSFAEGAADSRIEVRSAAVDALSHAVLDRHISCVPAGVLINILGDIVVPVLQYLGEVLVKAVVAETEAASRPPSRKPAKEIIITKVAFVEESMSCLCAVFLKQLSKLCRYPTFDKLWLRILHVFGFFLGASHGFDNNLLVIDAGTASAGTASAGATGAGAVVPPRRRELIAAALLAEVKLKNLIEELRKFEVFSRRPELWVVTEGLVQQFQRFPQLTVLPKIEEDVDTSADGAVQLDNVSIAIENN